MENKIPPSMEQDDQSSKAQKKRMLSKEHLASNKQRHESWFTPPQNSGHRRISGKCRSPSGPIPTAQRSGGVYGARRNGSLTCRAPGSRQPHHPWDTINSTQEEQQPEMTLLGLSKADSRKKKQLKADQLQRKKPSSGKSP